MNFNRPLLNVAGMLLIVLAAACANPAAPQLQSIPEVSLDHLSPEIRDQVSAGIASVRTNERDPEANGRLGMLLDAYSRVKEASVFYSRARFLDPGEFKWTYLHGLALAALGDDEAAIEALEQALKMRRGYPRAQLVLARLVYAAGDVDRAIALYTRLIERIPMYAQANYEYGKLLFEQGQTQAAIESLKTALLISNRYGQALYTLSQAYRELGDQENSVLHLDLFERYRRFEPGANDSLRDQIVALNISDFNRLQRSLILSSLGKQQQAAAELEKLTLSNVGVGPHVNLVAVYGELGDYEKAQEHADIALSIDPDSLELLDNIGVLHLRQQRYDKAEEVFRKAIAVDPGYSVPYKNLGALLEVSGRLDEAISTYRRSLALDPYDRQTRYFLARSLLADNHPDEAIAIIEVITGFTYPETPVYLFLLGQAYERKDDYENAVDAYKRALIAAQLRANKDILGRATTQLELARRMLSL